MPMNIGLGSILCPIAKFDIFRYLKNTKEMNVSLTPELEALVQSKVQSGRYQSASEVIREGLRLLDVQDRLREMQLAEVRQKIQTGIEQLDRGEGIPGNEAFAALKAKSLALRKSQKSE